MNAGRFIGRVGGLAVAFGIGVAVSFGAPSAWADDNATGGPSAGGDTKSSSAPESSGRTAATQRSDTRRRRTEARSRVLHSPKADHNPDKTASAESTDMPSSGSGSSDESEQAATSRRRMRTRTADEDINTTKRQYVSKELTKPPAIDLTPAVDATAPDAVPATVKMTPTMSSLPQRWSRMLDKDLGGSVASPMMWVIAAASRRELGERASDTQATSQTVTTTSAPANTAQAITSLTADTTDDRGASAEADAAPTTASKAATPAFATASAATGTGVTAVGTKKVAGYGTTTLSPDGHRAVVTGEDIDWDTGRSTTSVSVYNTSTGAKIGTTLSLAGSPTTPLFHSDGIHALVTVADNFNTQVVVIDTTTGTQTGTTLTLAGFWFSPSATLTSDKKHGFITVTNNGATRVVVADIAADPQTASSLTLDGRDASVLVSPDGARALLTTHYFEAVTGASATKVSVVNTATGSQIGTTLALTGEQPNAVWGGDGKHALITTTVESWTGPDTTLVTTVDSTTGAQTGATLSLSGMRTGAAILTEDRTLAFIITVDGDSPSTSNSLITIVDTATGTQVGTTVVLAAASSPTVVSVDGTRALFATVDPNAETTRVATINTSTGTQVGGIVELAGLLGDVQLLGGTALITTGTVGDWNTPAVTNISVINTNSGTPVGSTITVTGHGSLELTTDGTRALLVTTDYDRNAPSVNVTRIVMVNTSNAAQIGATLTYNGSTTAQLVTSDLSRVLILNSDGVATNVRLVNVIDGIQIGATIDLGGPSGGQTATTYGTHALVVTTSSHDTRASVVDLNTGKQIGTTVTSSSSGTIGRAEVLSTDGAHALIYTNSRSWLGSFSTRVFSIDTVSGKKVGTTLTYSGALMDVQKLTADGTRTLLAFVGSSIFNSSGSTKVAVVDSTTGKQIGRSVSLTGTEATTLALSLDRTRAVIMTETPTRSYQQYYTRVTFLRL